MTEKKLITALPSASPVATKIMDYTLQAKLPFWINNIAENLSKIRRGLDITKLKRSPGTPAVLVGAGPSVHKHKHLKVLAENPWKHLVIATDRMLIPCLEHGIVPEYVASVDASSEVAKFYDHKLVDENKDIIKGVFNVTVHPEAVKRFKGRKYWFVSLVDDPLTEDKRLNVKSISMLIHFLTRKFMMITLGNVGGFIWNLGCTLGCTPLILIGYDYSYATLKPENTSYWQQYLRVAKGKKKEARKIYHVETNPIYGTKYLIEPIFMTYRGLFETYLRISKQTGIITVNCTEGGALWGDYVKTMRFKTALKKFGG